MIRAQVRLVPGPSLLLQAHTLLGTALASVFPCETHKLSMMIDILTPALSLDR
jgi:hypothetical protein